MKKLLSILGIIGLTTSTTSLIGCNKPNKENIKILDNKENIKILEEHINNTLLDNIENSTKDKKSIRAEEKTFEYQEKTSEYQDKFRVNNKNIDLQLYILYDLRKEEAFFKSGPIKYGKITNLPPGERDIRRYLYNKIKDIQKGIIIFDKKEYKINQLLIDLANKLEQKYYL